MKMYQRRLTGLDDKYHTMHNFSQLSSVMLQAFCAYSNTRDLVGKKLNIIRETTDPELSGSYLFVGFSPACLELGREFAITEVEQDVLDYLDQHGVDYTYVDQPVDHRWDYTIALDEYFTFAASEQEQLERIQILANATGTKLITSLRDYKNLDYRDRDFSTPIAVMNHRARTMFLECHDYSTGQYSWNSSVYQMQGSQISYHGPYARVPMYFKQLAKFSYDAGATNFQVEKSLMYKGLVRKNFEHVISITF